MTRKRTLRASLLAALLIMAGLVAVPASPVAAQPRTIYVSPDGNDANPGTMARPKATIMLAAQALPRGGTIAMRGGTHHIANGAGWLLNGGRPGNPIVITSAEGEHATLVSAAGNFCVASDQSHITVRNITCTGAHGIGSFGGSFITVRNNRIHDITAAGAQGIILEGIGTRNIKVLNNVVTDVGQTGIVVGQAHPRAVRNVVIKGNTVRRANDDYEGTSAGGGWGSGISVIGAERARILGNRVHEIFGEGINCPLSNRCTVRNNVVSDTFNALFYADNTTNSVWENNVGWNTYNPAHMRDYGVGPRVASGIQFANESSWFSGPANPTAGNVVRNNVMIDVERGFVFAGYENGGAGMRRTRVFNNTFVRATCGIDVFDPGTNQGNEIRNNVVVAAAGGFTFCGGVNGTTFSHNFWSGGNPGPAAGRGDLRGTPQFVVGTGYDPDNYALVPGSPGVDAGLAIGAVGRDHDGTARPRGGNHDIGAFEVG